MATQPRRSPIVAEEEFARLEDSMKQYWTIGPDMQQVSVQVRTPTIPQPLLKRLGEPEFTRELTLQNQLEDVYDAISQFAMLLAYGDASIPPAEDEDEN